MSYNKYLVDNTCRGRIVDRDNGYRCVFEYGFDTSQNLCDLMNSLVSEIDTLNELLNLICNIDVVQEKSNVKDLIIEELRGLDTVTESSANAWHDYVLLSNFFDKQFDEHYIDYL